MALFGVNPLAGNMGFGGPSMLGGGGGVGALGLGLGLGLALGGGDASELSPEGMQEGRGQQQQQQVQMLELGLLLGLLMGALSHGGLGGGMGQNPFGGIPGMGGLGGSPFGGSPFGGSPFGGSPFGGSPFGGSPFGGSPFGGSPFGGSPFGGGGGIPGGGGGGGFDGGGGAPGAAAPASGGGTYDGATGSADPKTVQQNALIVAQEAQRQGVDPVTAVATMLTESGGNNRAVGDGGTSFGLFQLHRGGELPSGWGAQQAFDPGANAHVALGTFASTEKRTGLTGGALAAAAQRPANPGQYASTVNSKMNEARQILQQAGFFNGNGGG